MLYCTWNSDVSLMDSIGKKEKRSNMKLSNTLMINESLLPSSKKAFTLAEVLITLSILGVIAALTIPSLVNRYTDSAAQTKLRKAVADYEKFAAAYMAENEATDLSDLSCDDLAKYFKIVNGGGCTFTTSDGALWNFGTAANGGVGDVVIVDSEKGPRYGVVGWTHFGVVNGTTELENGQTPRDAAVFPATVNDTKGTDIAANIINGVFEANTFLASDSKTLATGKTRGSGSDVTGLGKEYNGTNFKGVASASQ